MRLIHETTKPRYLVQSNHPSDHEWSTECGFNDEREAVNYANERQPWWPNMRFQVVEFEAEGETND